jgi:hypothetical protein
VKVPISLISSDLGETSIKFNLVPVKLTKLGPPNITIEIGSVQTIDQERPQISSTKSSNSELPATCSVPIDNEDPA